LTAMDLDRENSEWELEIESKFSKGKKIEKVYLCELLYCISQ